MVGTPIPSVASIPSVRLCEEVSLSRAHAHSLSHMLCSMRFPGSTAEAAPSEGLAQKLQGVDVFDLSGKAVPIVDLWKERKAVVAFARHFGSVGSQFIWKLLVDF